MKVKKKNILTIDGIFSVVGLVLGLIITSLNLIYSNNYLITLGPLLAIASLFYLRFRDIILIDRMDLNLNFDIKTLKVINILYWISILVALISYHQASPYYRPPIFFISISLGVTLLGLEIVSSKFKDNFNIFGTIFKILLISLILRGSAYFISPYLVGSDPMAHAEYIKNFLQFNRLEVGLYPSRTGVDEYYISYPLMHLLAVAIDLIGNISIRDSLFIIGGELALSTIFVYLIAKKITGSVNLALFSMLLLNFADYNVQWNIEVIAMSFGIVIYSILIYLIVGRGRDQIVFTILFIFIIIKTHTVSSFIALISVICLYIGPFIYHIVYRKDAHKKLLVSATLCTVFVVLMLIIWMDPNYPFFEAIARGLIKSLSKEGTILIGSTFTIFSEGFQINIIGYLIYIFFGIIGCLYFLSKKYSDITVFSLIFMLIVLFFFYLGGPTIGLKNLIPHRWPAFIYVSLTLFTVVGFITFLNISNNKINKVALLFIMLFFLTFFMITNFNTNMDSPLYAKEVNQKIFWKESEIRLFENINSSYDGTIIADHYTMIRPFRTYLIRYKTINYPLTNEKNIDWSAINETLVIWRKASMDRPIQLGDQMSSDKLLETELKSTLDDKFSNIYDTGEAKAYLGSKS